MRLGTQNPVQRWQLSNRLSVEQSAQRIGVRSDRYRAVVVFGTERFTEEEIQKVLAATDIAEERLRTWERRLRRYEKPASEVTYTLMAWYAAQRNGLDMSRRPIHATIFSTATMFESVSSPFATHRRSGR